jgi:hypothetical protein
MQKPNGQPPRRFAEGTSVSAEKSRAEIEQLLSRHGATEFASYTSSDRWIIGYRICERMVRHTVLRPTLAEVKRPRKVGVGPQSQRDLERAQEAEWRRRWRAQLLLCKAKLELVASGQSSIDREFLSDVLLPDGRTVHEAITPLIERAYQDGTMPPLLLLGQG